MSLPMRNSFEPLKQISSMPAEINVFQDDEYNFDPHKLYMPFALYTIIAIPEIYNFIMRRDKYPRTPSSKRMDERINQLSFLLSYFTGANTNYNDALQHCKFDIWNAKSSRDALSKILYVFGSATECYASVRDKNAHNYKLEQWEQNSYNWWIAHITNPFSVSIPLFTMLIIVFPVALYKRSVTAFEDVKVADFNSFIDNPQSEFEKVTVHLFNKDNREKGTILSLPKYLLIIEKPASARDIGSERHTVMRNINNIFSKPINAKMAMYYKYRDGDDTKFKYSVIVVCMTGRIYFKTNDQIYLSYDKSRAKPLDTSNQRQTMVDVKNIVYMIYSNGYKYPSD